MYDEQQTSELPVIPALASAQRDEYRVQLTVAGFLAGYNGLTREAYALDLRQWMAWCSTNGLALFDAKRTHIELFARWLEQEGKARATVARRLSTIVELLPLLRTGAAHRPLPCRVRTPSEG